MHLQVKNILRLLGLFQLYWVVGRRFSFAPPTSGILLQPLFYTPELIEKIIDHGS